MAAGGPSVEPQMQRVRGALRPPLSPPSTALPAWTLLTAASCPTGPGKGPLSLAELGALGL